MYFRPELLEHGFTYLVLQDFAHLRRGDRVRLLESQYHAARDEGGYILRFSDGDSVALDHRTDARLIETIGDYLEKGEPFDWANGVAEYGRAFAESQEAYQEAVREANHEESERAATAVEKLVARGLSPKEAYQQYVKSGRR